MTGTDHHLTGLGQMVELIMHSKVHKGKPGHEGYLTEHVATLPEVLRDSGGYHTVMSGKWHLGNEIAHTPHYRGFDRSFALLGPAANHFAWEPEIEDGKKLPPFANINVTALHAEDGHYVDNATLPPDFYSSDFYVSKLVEQLNGRPKEKPFFAYLPFSAPHWPFQAQREDIEPYRGLYSDGPKALRNRRLAALKKLGLIPQDAKPHPIVAPEVPMWHVMTPQQRAKSARAMEAYAGMVARMDHNVGRVLKYLKDEGLYDNTQIIFMSDNGAEGHSYEGGPAVMKYIETYYDNSLNNIGNKTSFVWYGGRWAQAATAPSRLYKKFPTEGGVRVPFVFKPAPGLSYKEPTCHSFCTVEDIMPTLLDQAGIPVPKDTYNNRPIKPIRGTSWLPFLALEFPRPHPEDYVAGWELFGQAALRKGPWKINFVNKPFGRKNWELHNLIDDPGETIDLAEENKEKLEELIQHWKEYAAEVGVVGLGPENRRAARAMKDDMADPTEWMKFETSRSVAIREKQKRAAANRT